MNLYLRLSYKDMHTLLVNQIIYKFYNTIQQAASVSQHCFSLQCLTTLHCTVQSVPFPCVLARPGVPVGKGLQSQVSKLLARCPPEARKADPIPDGCGAPAGGQVHQHTLKLTRLFMQLDILAHDLNTPTHTDTDVCNKRKKSIRKHCGPPVSLEVKCLMCFHCTSLPVAQVELMHNTAIYNSLHPRAYINVAHQV